jgi:hypothetical protein
MHCWLPCKSSTRAPACRRHLARAWLPGPGRNSQESDAAHHRGLDRQGPTLCLPRPAASDTRPSSYNVPSIRIQSTFTTTAELCWVDPVCRSLHTRSYDLGTHRWRLDLGPSANQRTLDSREKPAASYAPPISVLYPPSRTQQGNGASEGGLTSRRFPPIAPPGLTSKEARAPLVYKVSTRPPLL